VAKQLSLTYIAGFIDGEGYIGIVGRESHGVKKAGLRPYITIGNNYLPILQKIQQRFPEGLLQKKKWGLKATQEHYTLTFYTISSVRKVLTAIEPYLVEKRPRAKIVLGWILRRHPNVTIRGNGTNRPYTDQDWQDYERLRIRI